jgi:predicted aldo/keto reductase-like oxidoreductase
MLYTHLGPDGPQISRLAMGCGRLPEDDEESTALIHAAIDRGVNFFETATFYCNNRCLEKTGLGIRGQRDEVLLQVKVGTEPDATADSFRREAESQMARLGVETVDFFQFGWLAWERLPVLLKRGGSLDGVRKMQDEGLVRYLGFTGHDTPENFIKLLETGLFGSMTVSYHLLNRAYEPTIARARELGVGVLVMNPVGGGMLANPSDTLTRLIPGGAASSADAALRFVLANPGATVAVSGMHSLAELAANVQTVETLGELTADDHARICRILDEYQSLGQQFCTGCKYCLPCPHGIDIPGNFHLYNYHTVYGVESWAKGQYAALAPEARADRCTECGLCEAKCPQHLPIRAQLAQTHAALGDKPHD